MTVSITYDEMGNPLTDGTWTYTWEHGRQLASMAKSGTTWTYTYDANGMRTSRSDGTTTYSYVYNGSKLMQMKRGAYTLDFTYDGSGNPSTVTMNGVTYYYITNLQGDVIEIRTASGVIVGAYAYDAWGNIVSTSSSMHAIGILNPLRYRGYVFDTDTGLYYLQSRYYNPAIGRFINADSYAATGQGVLGNNMFAYCLNNPVAHTDAAGSAAKTCLTADGAIDDTPWWDHSPGGGGFVYHCNNITTQYDGDKFLTQIALRHVGNFFEALWEAYVHSNELQVQHLHQQNMAVREHWDYVFANPERTNDFLAMVITDIGAYSAYAKLATASSVAFGPIATVVCLVGGAALTTLSYYGYIDVSGLTWEGLLG